MEYFKMQKSEARKEIKAKKRAMSKEEIEIQSKILCEKFIASEEYKACKSVYVYLPYNQEVRTEAIIHDALEKGKRVAVPKVFGEEMEFIWITRHSQIEKGAFNIPEPVDNSPIADDETALVLMPGLAFDQNGGRCGYGGGFYDKYFSKHPGHFMIALCYDFQLLEHIDTDPYDLPVNRVISTK